MHQINKITSMTVSVKINVDTPTGRKIMRDLEKHHKTVEIDNPIPDVKTFSATEVYERGLDKLSEHYGVDMRKLRSDLK